MVDLNKQLVAEGHLLHPNITGSSMNDVLEVEAEDDDVDSDMSMDSTSNIDDTDTK